MDLSGAGGDFRIGNAGLRYLLELAWRHGGWEPMGVLYPDAEGEYGGEPDMGYFTNDYQLVCAEDARNLADALGRALPDVPFHEAAEPKRTSRYYVDSSGVGHHDEGDKFSPLEWFSGPGGRAIITEFITYARAGSFRIG
jgi:hypothetical protein